MFISQTPVLELTMLPGECVRLKTDMQSPPNTVTRHVKLTASYHIFSYKKIPGGMVRLNIYMQDPQNNLTHHLKLRQFVICLDISGYIWIFPDIPEYFVIFGEIERESENDSHVCF